ncbi:MAG: hypothetical protein NTV51_21840 [Verrucomicrobia bacterium]|nr:hypothetical protein [Verrucomicrobiota bacterium]
MINEIEYSKVMKINPSVAERGSPSKWARMTRHAVACGAAMLLGLGAAVAQSIAVSTVAGSYPSISSGSAEGVGTAARFSNPQGIAVDSTHGIVYIADAANHKIRMYVISTGQVSTIAGTGTSGSVDNPTGTLASFNTPQGVALDSTGANLYVADTFNQVIRKIVLTAPFAVTTIAGTVSSAGAVDNAAGLSAKFQSPRGLVVDGTNLYVADTGNNSIRLVATGTVGNPVSTFAGDPAGSAGVVDGVVGTAARFNQPFAITSDGANLYVADTNNHAVRKIVLTGGVVGTVNTLAGSIGTSGSTDSIGTSASFKNPTGVTVKSGTVYVSDTLNNTIRQILVSSGAVSTLAGTAGQSGLFDGLSTAARFQGPAGIGVDGTGNLYIADTSNQTIRRGGAATIPTVSTPTTAPVAVGVNATFTVTVGGNPTPTIQWQRQLASGGSFSNLSNDATYSGVFTTTLTVTNPQASMNGDKFLAIVTNGVSPTPSVTSSSATLVVQQAPTITSANSVSFPVGSQGTFQFVATGSPAPTFSIISGNTPGSLNTTTGVYTYTPVNNSGSPFTFVVQASNGVGTPATQTFTLTIQNGAVITTPPANAVVSPGGSANFSVAASGTPATFTYQWYRSAGGVSPFFAMTDIGGTYSGSTGPTLTVFNATQGMSGDQFQVVVSNGMPIPPFSP